MEQTKLRDELGALLGERCDETSFRDGRHGLFTAWFLLHDKDELLPVCKRFHELGARLSMVTAMLGAGEKSDIIAYHFDFAGSTATVKVGVSHGEEIDSIAGLFRNADWHEREFMELYDIKVRGRQDARRLFLDESVEGQVMERLIPLSVLTNAASTNMLFEQLLRDRSEDL